MIYNCTDSGYLLNHRRSTNKNLEGTQYFKDFSKVFDFIHKDKIEQIMLHMDLSQTLQVGSWNRLFQLCKQEDSSRGLTTGNRSRESRTGRKHKRREIIHTWVPTDRTVSCQKRFGQSRGLESSQRLSRRSKEQKATSGPQFRTSHQRSHYKRPRILNHNVG